MILERGPLKLWRLAPTPHIKKVLCLNPPGWLSPVVQNFHVSLTGDSKVAVGVSGCVSLFVSPATDRRHVQRVPRLLLCDSWDRLQPHADPELKWKKMEELGGFIKIIRPNIKTGRQRLQQTILIIQNFIFNLSACWGPAGSFTFTP